VGATERLGPVEVRYTSHADTAILAFLHGSGRGWRVATDDRALGRAVREAGAEVVPAAHFWQKATSAAQAAGPGPAPGSGVDEEVAYFADERHRLAGAPSRVARKRARTRRAKGLE
jgi:hypothetical protein